MSFELQPNLVSKLIQTRPLLENDFDDLYKVASDPLIWELHPQSDRYQKNIFTHFFEGALKSKGALIILDVEKNIIGSSRYYDFDTNKKTIIIGYTFLARKYWGGKYNGDLKNLMLQHAFQYVDSVLFEIGEFNFRSRKAIEKIGAHLVGKDTLDGKNHVIYKINSREFKTALISR